MKHEFCMQVFGTANSQASTLTAALRQVKGLISLLKSRMTESAACGKVCQHSFPIGQSLSNWTHGESKLPNNSRLGSLLGYRR